MLPISDVTQAMRNRLLQLNEWSPVFVTLSHSQLNVFPNRGSRNNLESVGKQINGETVVVIISDVNQVPRGMLQLNREMGCMYHFQLNLFHRAASRPI